MVLFLMAEAGKKVSMRIGSNVPFTFRQTFQYHDVGIRIDRTVASQQGDLLVHTNIGLNTVVNKEAARSTEHPRVMRNLSLADDTVARPGKPAFAAQLMTSLPTIAMSST